MNFLVSQKKKKKLNTVTVPKKKWLFQNMIPIEMVTLRSCRDYWVTEMEGQKCCSRRKQ